MDENILRAAALQGVCESVLADLIRYVNKSKPEATIAMCPTPINQEFVKVRMNINKRRSFFQVVHCLMYNATQPIALLYAFCSRLISRMVRVEAP